MFRKTVSAIMLSLLVIITLTLAFKIQIVKADDGTIYINADGSVSPSDAPISIVDNVTYTFTGDFQMSAPDGIVVGRDNIVIDGNGHTVKGMGVKISSRSTSGSFSTAPGLNLTDVSNVTIENANIVGFWFGVCLSNSSNDVVIGNNVTASLIGIYLNGSSSNTLSGNTVGGNYDGIDIGYSSGNVVSGNNVTGNQGNGIGLAYSSCNVLSGNMMEGNAPNFGFLDFSSSDFTNSVDTSNLVNGKPIYYITNESNLVISPENYPNIGYLALVDCINMTVQGLTIAYEGQGILLAYTNDTKITNNNVTANLEGVALYSCSNDVVEANNANDGYCAIELCSSSNNIIDSNKDSGHMGIWLDNSSDNVISANTAEYSTLGIQLDNSSNNILRENTVNRNTEGIVLDNSPDTIVCSNNITYNGFGIEYKGDSSGDTFYHNKFIPSWPGLSQVWDDGSFGNRTWDDGYPSGGNYWSDYNGTDMYRGPYQNETGGDGIGDTPYGPDRYPLMGPYSTGPLSVTVSPGSATLDAGQSTSFKLTASGGSLPYTYQWFLNGTAVPNANSGNWTFAPTSQGSCTVYAEVTDAAGTEAASNTANVTVNSAGTTKTSAFVISPAFEQLKVGDTFTVTVNLTNAQNLDAWQVVFKYNGTCLNMTDLWVPDNNVFAGHEVDVVPPLNPFQPDVKDGLSSAMAAESLYGNDAVSNVTSGVLCCANFTVISAGQSLIEVAVQSDPLYTGGRSLYYLFYSNWLDNNTVTNEHDAAGSNCTVLATRLIGDINGDGKVDVKDLNVVAKAFGSYGPSYRYSGSSPSPNWNPTADLNGDGKVDIKDIALIAKNYGQHYP